MYVHPPIKKNRADRQYCIALYLSIYIAPRNSHGQTEALNCIERSHIIMLFLLRKKVQECILRLENALSQFVLHSNIKYTNKQSGKERCGNGIPMKKAL